MLYSVNILRNFQRRNCCKEITGNSQNIVRPRQEVIISVVIGSVGQPSSIGAPLGIFQNTLSRGVAFQWSIYFAVVSSTCKISWRTKLQWNALTEDELLASSTRIFNTLRSSKAYPVQKIQTK